MSAPHDNSNPDTQPQQPTEVINIRVVGGGEFGNRFIATATSFFADTPILSAQKSPVGDVDLQANNSAVDIDTYTIDVDYQVADELEYVINDPQLLQYQQENLLTLIGGGAGREWRRMLNHFEDYPELDNYLENALTAEPHTHLTIMPAGMTGATGMGVLRRTMNRIRNGSLPAPDAHPGVLLPLLVGPTLRIHDQQVNAIDQDHQRRAFANILEHLPAIRHGIQDDILSGAIFADNALLSLQQRTHNEQVPLSELRALQDPIRADDDWRPFIEDFRYNSSYDRYANNGARNDTLVRSVFPLLCSSIRPPELYINQGDAHFDQNDFFGELEGVSWLPGHVWLDDYSDIGRLIPNAGQPNAIEDALYPAAQYATYTTPAGFNTKSAERALVFAHLADGSLSTRTHGDISRTVAHELDIPAADVATAEINGLTDQHFPAGEQPELALNVMVGVSELEVTYEALGNQTLDNGL
jgi:hypothetical protein